MLDLRQKKYNICEMDRLMFVHLCDSATSYIHLNQTTHPMALHIYRFQKIRISTSYAISDLVFQVSRWITNNTPIWHAAVYLNQVCKPSFYLLRIGVQQVDIFHGSLHLAS
jgi:hypothetical protein